MLCGHMIPLHHETWVPCGQCYACRVNRLRKVVGQILMEAHYAENESTFLTITYNDDHLPGNGSLRPDHSYNFIDRLRKYFQRHHQTSLRFFLVGEYGSKTQRPHYHACLFGIPPEMAELPVAKCWTSDKGSRGFSKCGTVTAESAAYIAGYCTKKMGRNDERLEGRYPEYNRRSTRPPLGAEGIYRIADALHTRRGAAALAKQGTIPTEFRHNGKTYPISDYWREYLSEETGFPASFGPRPWEIDLSQFLEDQINAQKKAEQAKKRKSICKPKILD